MEIFGQFGLDIRLLIGQIINFLILVFIFKKFLFTPIMKMLKEREEKIKKGIEDSSKAAEFLENAGRESADIVRDAKLGAHEIVENARKAAEDIKNEMISVSKTESEKIIAQAKASAESEMQKAEKSMKELSLGLSQKILASVIETVFSQEDKDRILKKSAETIEKENLPS
ncbi:MAG: F0F1 ATP synthase subunit B [Elusimicrobiota bacterium]